MCDSCGMTHATWRVRWSTLLGGIVTYHVCTGCLPEGDDDSADCSMIEQVFVSGVGWLVRR